MTKETVLETLAQAYMRYFDIRRDVTVEGLPVAVNAEYHARDEKYVLVKKAKLWAAESNEYAYIVTLDELTEENLTAYFNAVVKDGLSRINPSPEHMRSDLTLVILTDRVHPEADRQLQQLKYSKSFLFSLQGWTQLRAVALEVPTGRQISNRLGREVLQDLKKQLAV